MANKDKKVEQNEKAQAEEIKQEAAKEDKQQAEAIKPAEEAKKVDEEETQESKLAKQIADLENALYLKQKEILQRDEKIKMLELNIQAFNDEWKKMALDLQERADKLIKQKIIENDEKFKKELDYAKKYAIKDQALELIDIISKFEQAVSFNPTDPKIANWLKGFQMYLTMFNDLLNNLGISIIKPIIGEEFDPNWMECFPETINDKSKKDNSIYEVIHNGYKLHDQLLKPATVKVVKHN